MAHRRYEKDGHMPSRAKLERKYAELIEQYDAAARNVSSQLHRAIAQRGINATIRYRVKSFNSYFDKLLRARKKAGAKGQCELTDLIGLRIICPFLSDLEEVEHAIREGFTIVETEHKGAQHSFREFGYDSIHLLIDLANELRPNGVPHSRPVAEVQLRTILQDAWAEVEHELVYKAHDSLLKGPVKRKLASLSATLTLSDLIFQEIRDYQKEVEEREHRRRSSLAAEAGPDGVETTAAPPAAGLIRQHGSVVDRLIFEALTAHSNSQYMKAIDIYSRLLQMNVEREVRSVIYNHRGMSYFALSEYRKSIEDFTRALRYNPENFNACNNRALCHRILHQYDRALSDLDRSLAIDGTQADGYYIRALTYFDLQDFAKALADCERVLNLRPDFTAVEHLKVVVASKIAK